MHSQPHISTTKCYTHVKQQAGSDSKPKRPALAQSNSVPLDSVFVCIETAVGAQLEDLLLRLQEFATPPCLSARSIQLPKRFCKIHFNVIIPICEYSFE